MVPGGDVGFVGAQTVKLIPTNLLPSVHNILPKKGKCGITPDNLMTHIKC